MNEIMVCFNCCVTQQPPRRRPRRIDRSMIGQPTDFRHTGHIGSADVGGSEAGSEDDQLNTIQTQMKSKGGYDHASPVHIQLNVIDVRKEAS